jgi:hypothetical protein
MNKKKKKRPREGSEALSEQNPLAFSLVSTSFPEEGPETLNPKP